MELRELFTPTIVTERIQLIESRIRQIKDALDQDMNVDALTGKTYNKYYFQTYWKSESREEFAHKAALP